MDNLITLWYTYIEQWDLLAADQSSKTFTIKNEDLTRWLYPGRKIVVADTPSNDGVYTVRTFALDSSNTHTIVTVAEDVPADQGEVGQIGTGGLYAIDSADSATKSFVIAGRNVENHFWEGQAIVIGGTISSDNNGTKHIVSSIYDPDTGDTTIVVVEVVVDMGASGAIVTQQQRLDLQWSRLSVPYNNPVVIEADRLGNEHRIAPTTQAGKEMYPSRATLDILEEDCLVADTSGRRIPEFVKDFLVRQPTEITIFRSETHYDNQDEEYTAQEAYKAYIFDPKGLLSTLTKFDGSQREISLEFTIHSDGEFYDPDDTGSAVYRTRPT